MKKIFVVLAIAGLASGLQAPLHYKYKYFASVATGIPELSSQASGWAMKADVGVFLEANDGTAIFQLSNVKTVEFNDNLGCDSRGEIPDGLFAYISDEDLAKAVETPFKAHLFYHEELSVEYPDDKFRWLVNLRKGIVSIFRNEVLKGNNAYQSEETIASSFHDGRTINVFYVEEETIFGKCKVQYSGHQIPSYLSRGIRQYKDQMETDIQLGEPEKSDYTSKTSKTSQKYKSKSTKSSTQKSAAPAKLIREDVPKLKDNLFRVIRTVNFDHCDEIVGLQLINSLEYSDVTRGQHDWRRGRSSVSELIFRGSPGSARLERAVVEGATTVAPFGFATELLQARTNQTLQLVSVTIGGAVPSISDNAQYSKTWLQEIWSFAEPPKYSKPRPWVVYTGESNAIGRFQTFGVDYLSSEQIADIKNAIIEKIKTASLMLTDVNQEVGNRTESLSKLLKDASYLFKFVSKEIALEIFEKLFDKDLHDVYIHARILVVDAAAASGYHYALDAVMHYIKEGKISDLQIMTIFMTLVTNAECAGWIPGILDWVLTLDIKEKPFLTSTVLINFAHLIYETCLHPNARNINFAGPAYGDSRCDRQLIMGRFKPYVMQLLEDEYDWIKIVGIKLVSDLRDPNIFEILAPFVEGKVKCSTKLRLAAIYALDNWKLDNYEHLKYPIVDMLTYVYDNIGEPAAVREAALLVVSTWTPDASFYHTLARTSWREPSRRFASYISTLIKFDAETEVQAASHAVKFTKPTAPSLVYSNIYLRSKKNNVRKLETFDSVEFLRSKRLTDVSFLFYFLKYEFGGLFLPIIQAAMTFEFEPIRKLISNLSASKKAEGITARIAKDLYDKIEESIKSQLEEPDKEFSFDLDVTFLNHLNLYLPINKYTLPKLSFSDLTSCADFILHLSKGYDTVLLKFLNPASYSMFHPTELGLPLFISGSTPTVFMDSSRSSFTTGSSVPSLQSLEALKKSELSVQSLTILSSEFRSSLSVLLPWNQKLVKVGVTSTRDITLPLNSTVRGDEREDGGHQTYVHFDIQTLYENKFSVIKASNTPYTSIVPILPLRDSPSKTIFSKSVAKETSFPIPNKYTGLDLHLTIKSETSLPFTFWKPDELGSLAHTSSPWLFYAYASPTIKYWYANLDFDPASSATKTINLEIMEGTFGKKESEPLTQKTGEDFYQQGQEGFGQYDQEQEGLDPQQGFQEIGNEDQVETLNHISYGDSIQQRSQKMQNHFGGSAKVTSFKVNFEGDEHRGYELLFSSTKSKISESRKIKKFQLSLIRSSIPDVDSKPASVCIDVQKSLPVFSKLHTFETLLNENLDKEVKAEVTLGCTGEPILVAKGSYHISDEWKNKYQNHLQEACDFDPNDPVYTFNHHAVYDDLKFTYTWEKVCDPGHFPIMTKLFNFGRQLYIDGILSSKCGDNEPERKVQINFQRCPVSENWFIDIRREDNEVSYKNIPNGNDFNFLFGVVDKDTDYYPDHYSTFNRESEKCIIGVDRVRTFDGTIYEYNPSKCWAVFAKSCYSSDKMLLVRSAQGESLIPDAKYIDVTKGLVIEYIKNTLRVNGKIVDPVDDREEIKDDEGKDLVVVYKKNGSYLAKFSDRSYISFKDKIELQFTWHDICGLCGNNDGEPENDLVGPQRCFYKDPNLFVASWSVGSDTCDPYALHEFREEVENFQASKSCKKIDTLYTKCVNFDRVCISHDWNITYYDDDICVSSLPIPICYDICDITEYHDVEMRFYCWPRTHAPNVLNDVSEITEENIHEPFGYEHHWEEDRLVAIPKFCKQH